MCILLHTIPVLVDIVNPVCSYTTGTKMDPKGWTTKVFAHAHMHIKYTHVPPSHMLLKEA